MSKSNSTEIIALLWLITGLTAGGWFMWVGIFMFAENTAESIYHSIKEHKQAKAGILPISGRD